MGSEMCIRDRYFSSQRAFPKSNELPGPGAIYEITGPFRGRRRT